MKKSNQFQPLKEHTQTVLLQPDRRDPNTEIAHRISNLQLDAGYDRIPTACKKGKCLASSISSGVAGSIKSFSSMTDKGIDLLLKSLPCMKGRKNAFDFSK